MTELEIANRTIEVLYVCAYVGFALWGIVGWVVGRKILLKRYIEPTELVNIKSVRAMEAGSFKKNGEIKALKGQISHYDNENYILVEANKALTEQNKRLWYWNYEPHRDAEFITIKQQDKNGDEVACSQIMLPDYKNWAYEPVAYSDDRAEDFYKWKDSLPHNQNAKKEIFDAEGFVISGKVMSKYGHIFDKK